VPMMSGRSLGHTGGTLDKLESIPGFRVGLSEKEFKDQLERIGVAIISQSEDMARADKKMYALRDVTATIDSIGLISASIMSKKLAEGADALVLDVKTGSGAFMKTRGEAIALAKTMVDIGKASGKKVTAVITDMNQPLGNCVGNALEIKQAMDVLSGSGPKDLIELSLELSARMLLLAGAERYVEQAKKKLKAALQNGKALQKFKELVVAQGGDGRVAERPEDILPKARFTVEIAGDRSGYVNSMETDEIGRCAIMIGAGRCSKDEKLDLSAGFVIHKKIGDKIVKGESLATMHFNGKIDTEQVKKRFVDSYKITSKKPGPLQPIYKEI
jgi:pyrimidine-nucleoside phosphorylase